MITICCSCQKVNDDGVWLEKQFTTRKMFSHGYCPDCFIEFQVKLDKFIQAKKELFVIAKKMERRSGEDIQTI
nr:hypothetical protein [Desulfobulbaceae bacterium]